MNAALTWRDEYGFEPQDVDTSGLELVLETALRGFDFRWFSLSSGRVMCQGWVPGDRKEAANGARINLGIDFPARVNG